MCVVVNKVLYTLVGCVFLCFKSVFIKKINIFADLMTACNVFAVFVDVVAALAVSVNVGTVVMSIAQRQNASIFFMLNMTSLKNLFSIQYRGGFSQAIV